MYSFFQLALQGIHHTGWVALLARRAARALAERHRRALAFRDLQSLDAYMLRDIGLSHRAAAECPSDRCDASGDPMSMRQPWWNDREKV